jgi:hypothetical protein
MSPPERESPPAGNRGASSIAATAPNNTCSGRQAVLGALASRPRPYKPSTGLRASGYREGYAACLHWVQIEFDEHLDEIGKARLAAVIARSDFTEEIPTANDVARGRKLCGK